MARFIPFSYSFSTTTGNSGTKSFRINGSMLKSFTCYIETDNVGPILIDAHVLVEGFKHQIGQEPIMDGEGYNAKKLFWTGEIPLTRMLPNYLIVNWMNYCGYNAVIRFSGVVKR